MQTLKRIWALWGRNYWIIVASLWALFSILAALDRKFYMALIYVVLAFNAAEIHRLTRRNRSLTETVKSLVEYLKLASTLLTLHKMKDKKDA